jgi:hypothetical protein
MQILPSSGIVVVMRRVRFLDYAEYEVQPLRIVYDTLYFPVRETLRRHFFAAEMAAASSFFRPPLLDSARVTRQAAIRHFVGGF